MQYLNLKLHVCVCIISLLLLARGGEHKTATMSESSNNIIHVILIFAVFSSQFVPFVECRADGSPENKQVCMSLAPRHGPSLPSKSPLPYNVTVSKNNVTFGDAIVITISSQNESGIRGFMFQARSKTGSDNTLPFGKWIPENGMSKGMNCAGLESSSLTHMNNMKNMQVHGTWVAPREKGEYEIWFTIVQDLTTYWVEYPSEVITVY